MKCHYVYDKASRSKVLIPGCWGTVHSNDMNDCYCNGIYPSTEERLSKLEEEVKELKKLIE